MAGQITIPLRTNVPGWRQDADGWWQMDSRRVILVHPDTGLVTVAADCPWDVVIDMHWANGVVNPGSSSGTQAEEPLPPVAPAPRKWSDIAVGIVGLIVTVVFLLFCISPLLVQCGVIRIP